MTRLTSLRLRTFLLLALLFVFASHVHAQANPPAANPPASDQTGDTAAPAPAPAGNTDSSAANTDTLTAGTGPTATQDSATRQTDTQTQETSTAATSAAPTSPAAAPVAATSVTTTADNGAAPLYTDAPSLQGVGIPPLIVPDTSGAPYMQKETMPEGTVFIAVGAILAFMGTTVLAWRGLVAWSLHRSVKHAANHQYPTDNKPLFGGPGRGYTSMYADSNVSLEHLSSTNTAYNGAAGTRQSTQNKKSRNSRRVESSQPSSSLFFSPTAGAVGQSTSTRTSSYLPAGFYASGQAAPAAGSSVAHVGGNRSSSYGHLGSAAASPPQSPLYPQQRTGRSSRQHSAYNSRPASRDRLENPRVRQGHTPAASESTMGLGVPPQGRAPSAYLDDLFENHGNGPRERF